MFVSVPESLYQRMSRPDSFLSNDSGNASLDVNVAQDGCVERQCLFHFAGGRSHAGALLHGGGGPSLVHHRFWLAQRTSTD